jgi:hypothetical protein
MAIERSYSYFAFLTKRFASFLASSYLRFANESSITYEENIPESRSMSRKYDTPRINEESKVRLHLLKKENYGKNINTTEIH